MVDKKRNAFDKNASLVIKGVAICMMIFHHCFLAGRYEDYNISFFPINPGYVPVIASFLRCVSACLHLFLDTGFICRTKIILWIVIPCPYGVGIGSD